VPRYRGIKCRCRGIEVSVPRYRGIECRCRGIEVSSFNSRRCKLQFRFLTTLLKNAESSSTIPDAARRFGDEICPCDDSQWKLLLFTADWRRSNAVSSRSLFTRRFPVKTAPLYSRLKTFQCRFQSEAYPHSRLTNRYPQSGRRCHQNSRRRKTYKHKNNISV